DLADAEKYSDEALQLSRATKDRPDELYALLIQGKILTRRGDLERSTKLFREVGSDSHSDTSLQWEAHNELPRLYHNQDQPQLADAEFRRSLAIVQSARSSLLHEELRLPFLSNAAHLYDDYLSFLIHQGKQEKALRVADYSRAQTLLEGLGVPSGRTI